MRLKSKYATFVALILLTATPHVFNQLNKLKEFAEERFRAELLNVFWGFTAPETRRPSNHQYPESLAGSPAAVARCNRQDEAGARRSLKAAARPTTAPWSAQLMDSEHRQPSPAPSSAENLVASASAMTDEHLPVAGTDGDSEPRSRRDDSSVAHTFSMRALFTEPLPQARLEDAVARLEWVSDEEGRARPSANPLPPSEWPGARPRLPQRLVRTSVQIHLPSGETIRPGALVIDSDRLTETLKALLPAKCRVRVLPRAPESVQTPEQSGLRIS